MVTLIVMVIKPMRWWGEVYCVVLMLFIFVSVIVLMGLLVEEEEM